MSNNNVIENESIELKGKSFIEEDIGLFILKLKNGIWFVGIPFWVFGITDRTIAAFTDGYLSSIKLIHLFTASFFFLTWLYLKPEETVECNAQSGSLELKRRHMISQEYILPFPYICQIYHLLNLRHLETIHKFSLNNLKVVKISQIAPTAIGGTITFETYLDSPFNVLRIWRQPIAEVDLILHTPYTVELSVPVYKEKRITVMFTAHPLTENEHYFFIDIYSDLDWPKPFLQILLHLASCLTLVEDLPYYRKLAERNLGYLIDRNRLSKHETMWLFNRFVELHGSGITVPRLSPVGSRQ
ncbi:hypothetical protein [Scytonema sp. NUACC26]|uniref:hypothetical protein n=1 Tax=Scytonema sp. NUACC26 TaxID=3140176 RepID=UPI0034DC40EA